MSSSAALMEKEVEAEIPQPVESVLTAMLAEIQGLSKDELFARIGEEVESRGLNMIRLGGLLERAEQQKLHKLKGHVHFSDWCQEQHGLAANQVQAYRRAYRVAAHSGLDLDELSELDTHKLTKLLPQVIEPLPMPNLGPAASGNKVVFNQNQKWLLNAKELSRADLAKQIASFKGKPTGVSKDTKPEMMKLELHPDQWKTALAAAALVKKASGHESDNSKGDAYWIDAALQEYLNFVPGQAPSLPVLMKKAGPETVLKTFEKLWPEIDVKAPIS